MHIYIDPGSTSTPEIVPAIIQNPVAEEVKKEHDVEMEEQKEPKFENRLSMDESDFHLKSEMSDAYEIDPFFGRTLSLDAIQGLSRTTQRIGRSESIRNPILTTFWKQNDSPDKKKMIKPEQNYMKLEERGFIRHLMLEGKFNEVLEYIENNFPEMFKEDKRITVAINCLKLVDILKNGRLEEAIEFGQNYLIEAGQISFPSVNGDGAYISVTALDFFSLIAFQDMQNCDFSFLLLDEQRETIADMINDIIIKSCGGKEYSRLEQHMKQLNLVQIQIREERNGLGEIFQFKIQK